MIDYFYPKLIKVEPLPDYCLRTTWHTGEILDLTVKKQIHKHASLAPILDPSVFSSVHVSEWGNSVEWFDEEFGADNVYAWAKEQAGEVSHQMLDEWMRRNKLSLTTASDALGISRRMMSYYRTAQKAIPRSIWFACLGWETVKPLPNFLPRVIPTAREYAKIHARESPQKICKTINSKHYLLSITF